MMHCPVYVVSLSLALLVLLGGFFLLAYAKKEGLGKLSKLASYVAILFGSFVFVGGLICAVMFSSCSGGKCEKGSMKCGKEMNMNCGKGMMGGSQCEKGSANCDKTQMMECHKKMMECHEGMGTKMHCEKNATENCCKEMKEGSSDSKAEEVKK